MPETKKSDKDIIADLLSNIPIAEETVVKLPSGNRFYKLTDPSKPITIRPIDFKDEKAIYSSEPGADVINLLLSRCVSNLPIGQLLLVDKLSLIFKLRELSYGDDYGVIINCNSCSKDNKVQFELSKLAVTEVPKDLSNPCDIHLPTLGKDAKVRLPRIEDEEYLYSPEVTAKNMWRFITDIDGNTRKGIISAVAENLPIKDAHMVLKVLSGEGLGVNTKVKFSCSYCSNSDIVDLPITTDFFTGN